jgi:cob(I)alamin adenosyltransferase
VNKSKIYTKTGDAGDTSLVSGNRTLKSDFRIDLYGELDELNSRIGVVCSHMQGMHEEQRVLEFLHQIQSAIFSLGSNLACEAENRDKFNLPQITADFIKDIEEEIDYMDSKLEPLKNFILPGGTKSASFVHLCRTCARSVERKIIYFHNKTKEPLPDQSIVFLNRVSDYFFVLARYLNQYEGGREIIWKPIKPSTLGQD